MVSSQYLARTVLMFFLFSIALHAEDRTSLTYFVYDEALDFYQSPYLLPKRNQPIGFVNEIVVKLFEDENVNIQVKVGPALRVFSQLATQIDTTWVIMGIDDMKPAEVVDVRGAEQFDRYVAVARYQLRLFRVRSDTKTKLTKVNDLTGKSIITISGGRYVNFEEFIAEGGAKRIEVGAYSRAIKILLAGRADYLVASEQAVKWHMMDMNERYDLLESIDFQPLDLSVSTISIYWGASFPMNLDARIRRKFEVLEKNGWLPRIRRKYGLLDP